MSGWGPTTEVIHREFVLEVQGLLNRNLHEGNTDKYALEGAHQVAEYMARISTGSLVVKPPLSDEQHDFYTWQAQDIDQRRGKSRQETRRQHTNGDDPDNLS